MLIKPYSEVHAKEITELFHQSVHAIDSSVYSEEQKEAWAPTPPNYEHWKKRLNIKKPYLAFKNEKLVGFIELELSGHIDCAYVHPDFQNQGVGAKLFNFIFEKAKQLKLSPLFVDASIVAKPFFEKRGFNVIQKNEVRRGRVILINYSMELITKF